MDEKWVKIFSTTNTFDAEMKQGLLAENCIEAIIMDKQDSSYHIGEAEIHVRLEDVDKANQIIQETINE